MRSMGVTCNFILVVRWECRKSVENTGNSQREGPEVGGTARGCLGLKPSAKGKRRRVGTKGLVPG